MRGCRLHLLPPVISLIKVLDRRRRKVDYG